MINYTPPTELHPIAVKAHQLLEQNGYTMNEAIFAAIRAELEALHGDLKALADAVNSLGALMLVAQQMGAETAMLGLVELIRTTKPVFQAYNAAVKESVQDQAQTARAALKSFAGEKLELAAAKVGTPAPRGAVPLASLMPNPALRRPPNNGQPVRRAR
jgi:hypothetical protein